MNKPGLKTSEFYMAMAVVILGAVASVYAEAEWAQAAGMIAAALASAGYGFARSKVKESEGYVERESIESQGYLDREIVKDAREMRQIDRQADALKAAQNELELAEVTTRLRRQAEVEASRLETLKKRDAQEAQGEQE